MQLDEVTVFTHRDEDGNEVEVSRLGTMCADEMCDVFVSFLLGCGFFNSSIANALREKADEMERDIKLMGKDRM